MSEHTAISWCDATFNPWMGCTNVGPGCDHCYAETMMDKRYGKVQWGAGNPRVRTSKANWRKPLLWEREHEAFALAHEGRRRRVFCASLADVFDNEVPLQWRADLFELIEDTPHLDWLLLTKRIGNVQLMLTDTLLAMRDLKSIRDQQWPWPNVWLGITVVNQAEAYRDIPKLLDVPARVRFLSIEPMLGPVDLVPYIHCDVGNAIEWVIAGGESGPNARPMHPDWVSSLRDQCAEARVPFHFKQWGEWMPETDMTHELRMRDHGQFECLYTKLDGSTHWIAPDDHTQFDASDMRMVKLGKKAAGRRVHGVEHNGFPA